MITDPRLVYVLGPAGADKDEVIRIARLRLDGGAPVHFAHRYITQPAVACGENRVTLSPAEFAARHDQDLLAMSWHSSGCDYGVGIEIDFWMNHGAHVVVNGSRGHLPQVQRRYDNLHLVVVDVEDTILTRRLREKGHSDSEINDHLSRHRDFMNDLPNLGLPFDVIDNTLSGPTAGEKLAQQLVNLRDRQTA